MQTAGGLEFVNRERELAFLSRCLSATLDHPPLIFLRGPAGVGKSSLTDRFRINYESADLPFCRVDPELLDSPTAPPIYQGLFLQRCAAAVDQEAATEGCPWPRFAEFLNSRRWKTAKEKPRHELIEELPSPESLYKQAVDYASRLLSVGRFEPTFLLNSDQSHAVSLCVSYLQHVLDLQPSVLVLREAQLSDIFSMRTLLGWQLTGTPVTLVLEYTSDGCFLPAHEKAVLRAAELRGEFSVLEVPKLSLGHLQHLIRTIRSDFSLESEVHLSWNGNLRSVLELKFRVGIGLQKALPTDVRGLLANLESGISDHIDGLAPLERMILALIDANAEPLPRSILQQELIAIDPLFRPAQLPRLLDALEDPHGLIQKTSGGHRIHNETIAQTLAATPSMMAPRAIAQRALREHYRRVVSNRDFGIIGMAGAVRQVFRLSALTKDVTGLVASCSDLLEQVRLSQDQTIYVDAVSAAVDADPDLYQGEYEQLRIWAASLAYDTSDWKRSSYLLEASGSDSAFALSMRAFALQEIGRHDEALELAARIRSTAGTIEEDLIARLIEILVRGCRGEEDFARSALEAIVDGEAFQDSPLIGFALRFFDVVDGLAASLPRLEASVAWFDRMGLIKARAYSELPTAILLARVGRNDEARHLIDRAREVLDLEVRDQHIILNDDAAVELLSDEPDAVKCADKLREALRYARDDFSELTIITNLSLAHWLVGNLEAAAGCAERSLEILEDHGFADRDIFWPVCFNAVQIFDASGRAADGERTLRLLAENRIVSANQRYWDFRFGQIDSPPDEYAFLAAKPIHPLYLSHWTVELEGLALLRREPQL